MDTILFPSLAEYAAVFPMLMLAVAALLCIVVDIFYNDAKGVAYLAGGSLLVATLYEVLRLGTAPSTALFGMVHTGGAASLINLTILLSGFLTVLLLEPYLRRIDRNYGEVYALLLVAVVGMMALGTAANLVTMFVGLETMSVCLYILAALVREKPGAIESALKYFLLGAFSTGFFLYGIALIYGATGTMDLAQIAPRLASSSAGTSGVMLWGGVALLLVGFLFKVSAAPFHMWTPDVYQGAPTPISGFMATASKTSAFGALILVLGAALPTTQWQTAIAVVALLSMVIGNVIALAQRNVKRMLAYSSIAHAGYILTGIAAGTPEGYAGALYYLLVYSVMNVGAFGVLAFLESDGTQGDAQTLDSLAGTGQRYPLLGIVMAVCLFSLLGFPPFAGFFGKVYVFGPAIQAGLTWLALAGVITSALSAAYYLRVLYVMWMTKPEDGAATRSFGTVPQVASVALAACAVLLLVLTFTPGVMDAAVDFFRNVPSALAAARP